MSTKIKRFGGIDYELNILKFLPDLVSNVTTKTQTTKSKSQAKEDDDELVLIVPFPVTTPFSSGGTCQTLFLGLG